MRQSATVSPSRPPPAKAISDRPTVHSVPWNRYRKWLALRLLVIAGFASKGRAEPAPARKQQHADTPEARPHHQRQQHVAQAGHDVGLEGPVGIRLDEV